MSETNGTTATLEAPSFVMPERNSVNPGAGERGPILTADRIELLGRTICADLTNDELALFVDQCNRTGLDPFARQIYAISRWDKKAQANKMAIQTSIDGFRLVAERTGQYQGQVGPFWCGADGVWKDVWLEKSQPLAAKVGIWRRGFREPTYAVALWNEYAQNSPMWGKLGTVMIAKCAESQALRRSFPMELSGLYTAEEMMQADESHEQAAPPTGIELASPELLAECESLRAKAITFGIKVKATGQPPQQLPEGTPKETAEKAKASLAAYIAKKEAAQAPAHPLTTQLGEAITRSEQFQQFLAEATDKKLPFESDADLQKFETAATDLLGVLYTALDATANDWADMAIRVREGELKW